MKALFAEAALLPAGWASAVRLLIDDHGSIAGVETGASAADAERLAGPVLPGMPNLHSHAFQRAMVGLTEASGGGGDDFWGWRETMYRFLAVLEPEDLRAIAAQLYLEMVRAGYTAVGEFHYLHHGRDGTPYADRAVMSRALLEAANEVGIGITLLPVLYRASGFGGAPPTPMQRRFVAGETEILDLAATLRRQCQGDPQVAIGLAPHSLRAVPPEALAAAIAGLARIDPAAPIHIHVAEQRREVEQSIAWSGARPVAWLLDHVAVDARWCLVHATHMDAEETARVAGSGAVVGLCPSTEGNLGDGFFPWAEFLARDGRWGIGSDSHVSIDPREELRWLDYGQRLRAERRAVTAGATGRSPGTMLWQQALAGGAQALARPVGRIAPGARADLVVLDPEHATLYGRAGDALTDSLIFGAGSAPIREVLIGGRSVVRDGHHAAEERIAAAYRRSLDRVLSAG